MRLIAVLAGLVALVSTAFRPAQVALLPALARTPEELTSANVASTTIESVAFFVGPALGGLLLAVTTEAIALGATVLNRLAITLVEALLVLVGAILIRRGHQRDEAAVVPAPTTESAG